VETFNRTAFKYALAVTLGVRPDQIALEVTAATARTRSRGLSDACINVLARISTRIPEAEAQACKGDTERNAAAERTVAALVLDIEALTDSPTTCSNALSAAAGGESFVVQEVLQGPVVHAQIMPVLSPSPPPLSTPSALTADESVSAVIGFTFLGITIAAGLAVLAVWRLGNQLLCCIRSRKSRRLSLLSGQKLPVEVQLAKVVSNSTYDKQGASGRGSLMRLDEQMSHVI